MIIELVKDIPILGIMKFETQGQLDVHDIVECQRRLNATYVKDFRHGKKWFLIMERNTVAIRDVNRFAVNNWSVDLRDGYRLKEYYVDRRLNIRQLEALERQYNGEFVVEHKIHGVWTIVMKHRIECPTVTRSATPAPTPTPNNSLSPTYQSVMDHIQTMDVDSEQKMDVESGQTMNNDTFVNSLMNSPYRV